MNIELNHCNTFIFDFDGVIVDSVDIKTKAYGELFSDYGESVARQAMEYHCNNGGVSRYEKFKYYYKHFLNQEITPAIIAELDKKYSQIVVEQVIQAPLIEGIIEFLQEIQDLKRCCFVISGTPQEEMRGIVQKRGLTQFFKEVLGSPKDKKENLKLLVEKYSLDPKAALFFGDSKSDYEAALEYGIPFIAVVDKSGELKDILNTPRIKNFKTLNLISRKEKTHA